MLLLGSRYLFFSEFYLFFVGLILLCTIAHDYWEIAGGSDFLLDDELSPVTNEVGDRIMQGIFRCIVMGLLVAVCMKLQSSYLTTSSENVLSWLVDDSLSVLFERPEAQSNANYSAPNQYTSLITAMATCVVYVYASVRIGGIVGF